MYAWQHRRLRGDAVGADAVQRSFSTRRVDVQNVSVSVGEAGSGPPALLLHGIPDTNELWADTMRALAPSYRCIAPELPDFGESQVTSGNFDWRTDNRAEFLRALLAALDIQAPIRLIAHDAGGTFGALFLAAHSELVSRAVFAVTTIHPDFKWHLAARINRTPVLGELAMAAYEENGFKRIVRRFAGAGYPTAEIDQVYDRLDGRMKKAILEFYRGTSRADYAPWQVKLESALKRVPTMVVWGALNPGADVAMARRSFPGAQMIVYDDVGHWPMIEAPERWRDDVASFLGA
ncbi:MAG: alpha/beta hydrolase [Parvularculaceae bacterium]|nr:alpha/beta hydrolase [Parvularculaceae bacterium]